MRDLGVLSEPRLQLKQIVGPPDRSFLALLGACNQLFDFLRVAALLELQFGAIFTDNLPFRFQLCKQVRAESSIFQSIAPRFLSRGNLLFDGLNLLLELVDVSLLITQQVHASLIRLTRQSPEESPRPNLVKLD